MNLDGTPVTGELVLPPLYVLGSDGTGAPLLWGVAGTYRFDAATGTTQQVSEQRLAGWGAAAFVDLGCDEGLPCRWRVHDRRTGETRLLAEPVPDDALRAFFDRGRVSPDGQWLARVGRDGSSLQLVDLTTGATRALVDGGDGAVTDPAWSPDGRWLFWLGADQITAWQVGRVDPVVVSGLGEVPELVALSASTALASS
jgi:dipeptidyl aminopeptidase/acylaminoacyl peptidase